MSAPAALAARFADPDALAGAVRRLRQLGYRRVEAFTPFPIPQVAEALGEDSRAVPWIAGGSALFGVTIMIAVQWWAGAAYPLDIGGRPVVPWPSFVSSTAIVGLLWMAIGTFAGFLWLTGLPRLHHPIFDAAGFEKLWSGRLYLMVAADDPRFDADATAALLETLGGTHVERIDA